MPEPWGKCALRKISEHSREKGTFNFPRMACYFQNCPINSWNYSFVFQKCFFISQKCPSFPEFPLIFQKGLFLFTVRNLFSRMLFSTADFTFSSSCLEPLRQIFALLLFCFFLELFTDQLVIPS